MQNWLLQNLSDVLNREVELESNSGLAKAKTNNQEANGDRSEQYHNEKHRTAQFKAQQEWFGAIASIEKLLLAELNRNLEPNCTGKQGLIFAAPVPFLSNESLISYFQSAVFRSDAFNVNALMPCRQSSDRPESVKPESKSAIELPLIPQDPIEQEQFCLIFTANFGLIVVLGQDDRGMPKLHFSFNPATLGEVWSILRARLVLANYCHLSDLDNLIEQFAPPEPSYRLVTSFSRDLIQNIPHFSPVEAFKSRQVETIDTNAETEGFTNTFTAKETTSQIEMELLQALTHEVRTPLTTIRTLTKLLLKRQQDFKPNVVKRLKTIDRECTEQIERMELIFRAAELESTATPKSLELVPFSLDRVFQESIPRWQEKAQRRNVKLEFVLPPQLPKIVSNPVMLDTVLTGLMESCTRSLPTGGHIEVKVSTAGDRLKLQLLSQATNIDNPFKSLGQLLTFQPATGCLSLNLDVTKNIFQVLGGKLTVRQRQQSGKEWTIFLPLGNTSKGNSYLGAES